MDNIISAGIILFNNNLSNVLIVNNYYDIGFPKGGRKKYETIKEAAFREFEEETGLSKNNIILLSDQIFIEYSKKNKPYIGYYVCKVLNSENDFKFCDKEIKYGGWVANYDALQLLKFNKKNLFEQILDIYNI